MKTFTIHKSVLTLALVGVVAITTAVYGEQTVNSLSRQVDDKSTRFTIHMMGAGEVYDFMMKDPPRLVVDFIGAAHRLDKNEYEGDGRWIQKVRTSQFTNPPNEVTRVVFDMKMKVPYEVTKSDDEVVVVFSGGPMTSDMPEPVAADDTTDADDTTVSDPEPMPQAADDEAPANPAAMATDPPSPATVDDSAQTKPKTWVPVSNPCNPRANAKAESEKSATPNWSTGNAWGNSAAQIQPIPPVNALGSPHKFSSFAANTGLANNRNITIDVQNADIKTVLRSLAEFSGTNIIAGPEVEGKVTAHLKTVPWRQAMDIVLKAYGFGWREEYGIIRVSTIDNLMAEELQQSAAERKKDELLPLVTRILPLSFSNSQEMRDALKKMSSSRGSIEVEKGNNVLIVTDIERITDKIALMVAELDRRTQQVEIVAKMVDVDYEVTREFGIRWDLLNLQLSNGVAAAGVDALGTNSVSRLSFGTVQSWGELQLLLEALEKENKADIISNPRIVTTDNREAKIMVGKEIPLIVSDEAGNPITELTKVGIMLRVTPHVNKDESITLDLHPEVSDLSSQATVQGGIVITLMEADTRVVVQNGETAVIGGLINEAETHFETGVPILKDIPGLGALFRFTSTTKKKRELIIFVTPTIVRSPVSNGG